MSVDQQNGYIAGMTASGAYACTNCPNCTCAQRTTQAKEAVRQAQAARYARQAVTQAPNVVATGTTFTGTLIDTSSGIVGTGMYAKPPRTFTREEVLAVIKARKASQSPCPGYADVETALDHLILVFGRME